MSVEELLNALFENFEGIQILYDRNQSINSHLKLN